MTSLQYQRNLNGTPSLYQQQMNGAVYQMNHHQTFLPLGAQHASSEAHQGLTITTGITQSNGASGTVQFDARRSMNGQIQHQQSNIVDQSNGSGVIGRAMIGPANARFPEPTPCSFHIVVHAVGNNKKLRIEVNNEEKVDDLKNKIYERVGMSPCQQKLVSPLGKEMQDGQLLKCYGLREGSEVTLTTRLRGG